MARTPIHPGEHLAEELEELGMSAAELARQLRVSTNSITGILNGQRAVTGDTAPRLAHFFGTSAQFWLNLQAVYELRRGQHRDQWAQILAGHVANYGPLITATRAPPVSRQV